MTSPESNAVSMQQAAAGTILWYQDETPEEASLEDADALDRKQHRQGLPNALVQTGRANFFDEYRIRFLQRPHALRGHLTNNSDGESRSGKRMTLDDLDGQPEFSSQLPNLVFEQLPERFNKLEVEFFRQSANVMMTFNRRRRTFETYRFNYIRIQRSLC